MRQYFKSKCRMIAVVSMTAFLSFACAGPQNPSTPQPTQATLQANYDTYDESSIKLQKEFDLLTEKEFIKNITQSALDLHFTLYDPSSFGITDLPAGFQDFSLDIMNQDMQENKELKSKLDTINPDLLTKDQQVTYRILQELLKTELSSEGMELYYQPLGPTIGTQAQLPVLLAEYTFYDKEDIEQYLALLSQIDEFYAQILEFEKEKAAAGLFMSDTSVDHIIDSCAAYLLAPEQNFLTETFQTRLDTVPALSDEEKAAYLEQHKKVITEHFIPAYQLLVDGMTSLKGSGTNEMGICYFPRGKEYYSYLVKSSTGTSYSTVEKLKKAVERQMDKDLTSMAKIIKAKPELLDQVETYKFRLSAPDEILNDLQVQITKDFPELPACTYTVKHVPKALENTLSPAFYLTPPIDRFEDNTIYINGGEQFANTDLYTTLAHEGYPGHLYQTVYFTDNNDCNLRKILSFSGYTEGWATYVEHYSYTLDNGLDPDLAKIMAYNSSVSLGLHALLDMNVNYFGWTKEEMAQYLSQYYEIEGTDIVDNMYSTLVENPTNYLEYYVGYLEFENMKETASNKLNEDFNLKDFHTFLLDLGPAQFSVIKPYFTAWLVNSGK